jgi:hypothetical protein
MGSIAPSDDGTAAFSGSAAAAGEFGFCPNCWIVLDTSLQDLKFMAQLHTQSRYL